MSAELVIGPWLTRERYGRKDPVEQSLLEQVIGALKLPPCSGPISGRLFDRWAGLIREHGKKPRCRVGWISLKHLRRTFKILKLDDKIGSDLYVIDRTTGIDRIWSREAKRWSSEGTMTSLAHKNLGQLLSGRIRPEHVPEMLAEIEAELRYTDLKKIDPRVGENLLLHKLKWFRLTALSQLTPPPAC